MTKITVHALVNAPIEKTWEYFTNPAHVVQWNNASPEWHCPKATNDLKVGGKFSYTMAAKDGSMSFDFEGTYSEVTEYKSICYVLADDRKTEVLFTEEGGQTKVVETFDAEAMNSIELQQSGWQAILDNFKQHTETN